jgi:hypothetical protein
MDLKSVIVVTINLSLNISAIKSTEYLVTTNAVTSLLKNLQCHECPARAITGLVKEAFRVLRPGGTIALTDNSVGISFVLLFLRVQVCNLVKKTD